MAKSKRKPKLERLLTAKPSKASAVIKDGVKYGRDTDVFKQAMRIFDERH